MTYLVKQISTGKILEFKDEQHYIDWFDWYSFPFEIEDNAEIIRDQDGTRIRLTQLKCPVEQPIVRGEEL